MEAQPVDMASANLSAISYTSKESQHPASPLETFKRTSPQPPPPDQHRLLVPHSLKRRPTDHKSETLPAKPPHRQKQPNPRHQPFQNPTLGSKSTQTTTTTTTAATNSAQPMHHLQTNTSTTKQ
ncbi:hypothetical protein VTJ04DRAFT_10225 [Mycothermus thermophilus]|uniref:uncharacterized protein n=1 Tax=Humicola insolens TaxID=85995 RepID=UPI0037435129